MVQFLSKSAIPARNHAAVLFPINSTERFERKMKINAE